MVRTTYTDGKLIRERVATVSGTPDEERMLVAAAALDDLGITVTDNESEANEVRGKIPEHLLYSFHRVDNVHLFIHARLDALPAREK